LQSPEIYAYQHMLLRAWEEMYLSGVLTLNGIPTVYLREEAKPVTAEVAANAQLQFWNQGVATVLLLRDRLHGLTRMWNLVRVLASIGRVHQRVHFLSRFRSSGFCDAPCIL
jgi:hypothetical protein